MESHLLSTPRCPLPALGYLRAILVSESASDCYASFYWSSLPRPETRNLRYLCGHSKYVIIGPATIRVPEADDNRMPIPFEFVLSGPPVSQQARRRERVREWQREVRRVARAHWGDEAPFDGEVMVTITYFFEVASLDVDNIPKPILDALKGVVYSDDSEVTDLLCRKRDLNGDLRIPQPSALLLETLGRSEQFLHVIVVNAPNQEGAR